MTASRLYSLCNEEKAMFNKSKLAFISAVAAVSMVSPALAQAFNPGDGTGNALPLVYGPGGTRSRPPVALHGTRLQFRQSGLYDFAAAPRSRSTGDPSGYDPSIATQR
jgi:hypothetical protein